MNHHVPAARPTTRRAGSPQVLTHPERVLFADEGLTKADLQRYFEQVQPALWAHLERRPVSILRAAGNGKSFFQRHADRQFPQLFLPVAAGGEHDGDSWMRLRSAAAIGGLAQPGVVELHAWNARVPRIDRADRLVLDLDPDPGLDWPTVRTAAILVRDLLQNLGLESRPKTSGGAGLHVVVPVTPTVPFELAASLTEALAQHLARALPRLFTARRGVANRRGRVFVDWQRNQVAATTVAAWSPRLRRGAPVSMPLDWDELGDTDLRFVHFNLRNAPQRLATRGDPWLRRPLPPQRLAATIRQHIAALGERPARRVRPARPDRRPGGSARSPSR